MDYLIAAVGRARKGPERALFEHYAGRLRQPLVLKECEEKRPLPIPQRVEREAQMLLAAVPSGARVVVLDERGKTLSSEAFAALLGDWRDQGIPCCAFLIGGADGHGEAVRAAAEFQLAFGPMTWPHMLVRALLAEQLYRAQSILEGHPYHRA